MLHRRGLRRGIYEQSPGCFELDCTTRTTTTNCMINHETFNTYSPMLIEFKTVWRNAHLSIVQMLFEEDFIIL